MNILNYHNINSLSFPMYFVRNSISYIIMNDARICIYKSVHTVSAWHDDIEL